MRRSGIFQVPLPLQITAGVVMTCGLGLFAAGVAERPRWMKPLPSITPADVERVAAAAGSTWRRAVGVVAAAKHVAPGEALIGSEMSPLVTTLGDLEAKRVSVSDAWPAAFVREFHRAGLRPGDVVAASFSGSFPGLNLAVASAAQAMGLELTAVSSVTASSWGATDPGFTWPEVEGRLVAAGIIRRASIAVTAGGAGDRALDLEEGGRDLARSIAAGAARALRAQFLEPSDFDEAIRARLDAFDAARGGRRIAVFVNVGGTEAALGRSAAILRVSSGWLGPQPFDMSPGRGLVARMVERGVPVLHVLNVRDLAVRWGVL